jgi:drug/metabolite transporter (DMT)-like permease
VIAGVPLVGTVIAFATGSADRMGPVGLLGLLLGIVGVTAIVGSGMGSTDPVALAQLGLVAVCYAVGPVILVRKLGDLPSVGVMALSLAITAVVFTPIGIVSWPAAMPSPAAITSILVLAVFCTAVAFLVFAALVAAVGAVRSTVITYINPAVAAVLGVAVLGETLTPPMLLGFVLVTLGSVLATRRPPGAAAPVPVESADPA